MNYYLVSKDREAGAFNIVAAKSPVEAARAAHLERKAHGHQIVVRRYHVAAMIDPLKYLDQGSIPDRQILLGLFDIANGVFVDM